MLIFSLPFHGPTQDIPRPSHAHASDTPLQPLRSSRLPANKRKQVALDWKPFIVRFGLEDTCSHTCPVPFCSSPEEGSRRQGWAPWPHSAAWCWALPIRKTSGEGRAEGLQHTSGTCSLLYHTVSCPERPRVTLAQMQPGQHLSRGHLKITIIKKKLEDKFGPEDGVNPKTLCRSISATLH